MSTIAEIFRYLIQTACSLFLLVLLMRMLLQLVRADFYNPISQFVVKLSNPLVLPLRRLVPPFRRLDLATLLLALALQCLGAAIVLSLAGYSPPNVLVLLVWGSLGIVAIAVHFYYFAVLAMILVSWLAPHSRHPAIALLYQLTEPVMNPFRRLLPPMGAIDFSPILLFVAINVLRILLAGLASGVGLPHGVVLGI